MHVVDSIVGALAWIVITFTLLYVFGLTIAGLRQFRRSEVGLSTHEQRLHAVVDVDSRAERAPVYFLIPCLNEAAVIGATLDSILAHQPGARVIVIDDGSEDETASIALSKGRRVQVVRRQLPNARLGKGAALNAGIQWVRTDAMRREFDTSEVLVCVMDADGRLTPDTVGVVGDVFAADPAVGGLQLVVRIRNRDNLILRFQDMEFWAMSGVGQLGRVLTGTVSMGGNGQFTRLSALDEIGPAPWSDSLTEDLDLGISLSVRGWKTTSTAGAYVTQQGVGDVRRLVRQRSRWYQGHMQAGRRLLEVIRSPHMSNIGCFELSAYLAVPWLITLPWSLIQQYILANLLAGRGLPSGQFAGTSLGATVALGLLWYVVSFAPHLFWGWLYWRRAEEMTIRRAVLMAHLMVPWSYLAYFAAWRALGRMLVGRRGWAKTARTVEAAPSESEVAAAA